MGKPRQTATPAPKPATPKPAKKRAKKGEGKWTQVNLRLAREEYALFITEAKALGMTAPGLAKHLVDEYMRGKGADYGLTSDEEE